MAVNIDRLNAELKQLQVEFERYFSGAVDLPPLDEVDRLAKKVRDASAEAHTSVESFQANALEARFNSYREMFNRRVRDLEEGRSRRPTKKPRANRPAFDASRGIAIDASMDEGAVAALYQGLYAGRANAVDLDSFRNYLARQVETIQQKSGCQAVRFRLSENSGKTKLRAKPIP